LPGKKKLVEGEKLVEGKKLVEGEKLVEGKQLVRAQVGQHSGSKSVMQVVPYLSVAAKSATSLPKFDRPTLSTPCVLTLGSEDCSSAVPAIATCHGLNPPPHRNGPEYACATMR
jgi:hypothetical protein